MTFDEFESQIDRLNRAYSKAAFPTERTELIWRQVRYFDLKWFTRIVEHFISSEKYAPLPVKFYEVASIERERLYLIEKEKNRKDVEEFVTTFRGEDIQTICGAIIARAEGRMGHEQFDGFVKGLKEVSKQVVFSCQRCEDTGQDVWTDERGLVWAKRCDHGRAAQRA